jgi:DNA-binding MarR family transcriptional regulator
MAPPEASETSHTSGSVADVVELVEAVDAAQAVLRTISEHALEDLGGGITTTQLRLLEQLQRLGESRLVDLADALSIAPSTATRLCDTLAERQLIVRHRRGRDRRELQIQLTEAGTKLLDTVRARSVHEWSRALAGISEGDRRYAARVLADISAVPPAPSDAAEAIAAAEAPAPEPAHSLTA